MGISTKSNITDFNRYLSKNQNSPQNWEVEKLSPHIGAILHNFDMSRPLSVDEKKGLKKLLLQHQVVFLRGQKVTPAQHRDFAASFGPLHIHPVFPTVPDVPEVIVLDTAKNDLRDNALWHTDVTFSETPPLGAVLVARKLPPTGGDTLWASASAAYEALSPGMKIYLKNLTALHDFTRSFPLSRFGRTEAEREKWFETRNNHPPVEHPVIRVHPETGQKAIFVNEGFTTEIVGLEHDESQAVLSFLFKHVSRPEFQVRWVWKEGDVAFWDNRITQHYAVDNYRPHHRIMNRVTIMGDKPFGPSESP